MFEFTLSIKLDNIAVDPREDGGQALGHLVQEVGVNVAGGVHAAPVRDANGNPVGRFAIRGWPPVEGGDQC